MFAIRACAACWQSQSNTNRQNMKLRRPKDLVDPNPACLERLIPRHRASGGAGDGGTGRDSLHRGGGGEELFENLAVQVSLETGNKPASAQETNK